MAEVSLAIGGRHYDVHCGDGEENHLRRLAEMIDAKTAIARRGAQGLTEVRQLLFAAILLADEIHDLRAERGKEQSSLDLPPADNSSGEAVMAARMNVLAARIEALAETLAGEAATS
tara:strand:+ start:67937 stop:68287 length:351 start_codon:yes stop_codon:yes gene_type:complete